MLASWQCFVMTLRVPYPFVPTCCLLAEHCCSFLACLLCSASDCMCTGLGGLWMIPCLLHHFVSPHCHKVVDIFLWIAQLILPHIHPFSLLSHCMESPHRVNEGEVWTLVEQWLTWLTSLENTRSHTLKTPLLLSLSRLNFTQVASCHGFLYHAIPLLPGLPSSFQPASHTAITRHCIWATSQLKSTQTGRQSHH